MTEFADIEDGKLAYTRDGSGAPLLCLHGGMGVDAGTLRVPGVVGLADRGCEVVVFDQRGHGDSSRVAGSGYTHELWATDARRLAQHLGWNRFTLLGHSYGGFIALEYAIRWPQTLRSLILVSTSAGPVSTAAPAYATDGEVRDYFAGRWPGLFVGSDKHWEVFDQLRFSVGPYAAAFARELPVYDLRTTVHGISVPVLLIVGSEDHYKSEMEWLADKLPNASLHVFPKVGHMPFLEAPGLFRQTVSAFLSSIPSWAKTTVGPTKRSGRVT